MSDIPSITVAIPTMNGERHVAESVQGVLAQEGVSFDWIISDDRSDDQTLAIIRSLAGGRARIVVNETRLGLARNWNRCVALSRTPLVAILHQDDVWHPGHLASHVRAFGSNQEIGLVASASRVIDDEGNELPESVVSRGGLGASDRVFLPGEATASLAVGNPLRCSAVSIRVDAHREVGRFNPALRYVVDWDFWLHVAERSGLAWLATETVDVRWHLASETHRFATGTADLEETEAVLAGLPARSRGFEREAHRRLSRAYLNRAHVALRSGDGPLARRCLLKSLRLWPGVAAVIAADPRLAVQMAGVLAVPRLTGRWLGRDR